ncbi:hypothetical protein HA466_0078550 [Hirschfeldia incana]|nr:hypothetical protein HA466_0078550 [Hirschfeldia incana]
MVGVSEPPLVPPVPPDLLFLLAPESVDPLASSQQVVKDTIMAEASTTSDKIDNSLPRDGASPNLAAPPSGLSVPATATVKSLTAPIDGNQAGASSSPSGDGKAKGSSSQGTEFNWLSRAKTARQFPKSDIPVTQSGEGVPRVKIPNSVFERGAKAHSDYIVGIFYGNAPSYGKIWGVLNYLWGRDRRVTIHNLSKNAFLFHIPSVALRQRILQHELWRVGDSPFFVTEWKASYSIDPPSLQRAPIWATLNKVPFDLLTDEGLEIIAKPLGKIVDAKPFSSVSSVDVKVVVDLTVKLPDLVEIERENGSVDVLEVTYAWLPPLCPVCNEIGHKANFCPTRKPQPKRQDQNGVKKSSKTQKSVWRASDKSKASVSDEQITKEAQPQEQTVPVKSCINSVLADLERSTGASLVGGMAIPPCPDVQLPAGTILVEVDPNPISYDLSASPPQGMIHSVHVDQSTSSSDHTLPPSHSGPVSSSSQQEEPFIPAVKTVSFKFAVGSSQEIQEVVSYNPFAALEQEEDPPSLKDEANLSLVVAAPVSSQSFPSLVLSKTQRTKKRKLAKSEANSISILSVLGPSWKLIANYQYSDLGKVWLVYKDPIKVQFLFADYQSITVKILPPESLPFYFTAVYASNELEERRQLWISLKDTAVAFDLTSNPWMVCGDFNEILDPRESSNPSIITSTRAMREFGSCLSDIGLFDLASQGPNFSWSNHRPSDPIGKKIDRCLVNDLWQLSFPKGFCSFEPPEFSDHTPCHIRLTSAKPDFGTRSFMFPSYLIKLPSFVPTIKDCWLQFGGPAGNLTSLCFKLKQLKSPIKSLCKENFSQIEKRVQEAKSTLDLHQIQALNSPSQDNIATEKKSREIWLFLCLAEEMFFRQRSRIKWLEAGDLNTQFFHRITLVRNALNGITYLLRGDGSRSQSLKEVHQIAAAHFAGILCSCPRD